MGLERFREALASDVLAAAPLALGLDLALGELRARIVEVEAYRSDDPGCHAFGRRKMKNMALYGPPGSAYVYFSYGAHWMLNVVAHAEGDPAALLVRAARPLAGIDAMRLRRPKARRDEDLLSGPGKLTAAFGIDFSFNGANLVGSKGLRIVEAEPAARIAKSVRIGLAQGKGHELEWRFYDPDSAPWTSRNP